MRRKAEKKLSLMINPVKFGGLGADDGIGTLNRKIGKWQ